MTRGPVGARRALGATALLLVLGVTGACTSLPDSGPVVDVNVSSAIDDAEPNDITAVPPSEGDSPSEIVDGFFDAMTASPISTEVAGQYLSASAQDSWRPEDSTITYVGSVVPRGEGPVEVTLTGAERLDRSGAWEGRLTPADQTMTLTLVIEDGQYRIADPPDALIVPASWFSQRFRPASLYFFDPSARILVPEPVFVPNGEQLASALVSGLVAGPTRDLQHVVRSFLPEGLSVQVSVPVSEDGLADITLLGEPGPQPPAEIDRMFAQLAWTLQQEPAINALRVSIGDEVLRTSDGEEEYDVDDAVAYDPTGASASDDVFALRDGLLTVRDGADLDAVSGPFGTDPYGLEEVAVDLDATRAAGVSSDGGQLLVADVDAAGEGSAGGAEGGTGGGDARVRTLLRGSDLLRPAWDFADRVWSVDRNGGSATVRFTTGGRSRELVAAGVTGRDVRRFLVSRDGTRFVAVVRSGGRDELRLGRIEVGPRGRIDRIGRTEEIALQPGVPVRIRDVAWSAPSRLALLVRLDPAGLFEVRTVSVDGSPASVEALPTVTEPLSGLVGSPRAGLPLYGTTRTGLIDLAEGGPYGFVGGTPSSIAYVG